MFSVATVLALASILGTFVAGLSGSVLSVAVGFMGLSPLSMAFGGAIGGIAVALAMLVLWPGRRG